MPSAQLSHETGDQISGNRLTPITVGLGTARQALWCIFLLSFNPFLAGSHH